MRSLLTATLPFFAIGCSSDNAEKEEINIENMVLNDATQEKWTTGTEEGEDRLAEQLDPLQQERIIAETPDAPVKLNSHEASSR